MVRETVYFRRIVQAIFQRDGAAVAAIAVVGDARILSDGHRSRTIDLVRTIAGTIAPPNAIA